MYNSKYYTCEEIDQRLLQGYLDDYNTQNNTQLTKEQYLTMLGAMMGRSDTIDNLITQVGYYTCDTVANDAAKVLSVTNYELMAGGSIKIKFNNSNTADNVTLNINNKGAKPLYYNGELVSSSNFWEAGETVEVYYDGTNYYANNVVGIPGVDEEPTAGSRNLVESGGVSKYLAYNYTKNSYTNSLVKELHIEGEKDPTLKYFIRGCQRFRSTGGEIFYLAIQSYNPTSGARSTIAEFSITTNISSSGIYSRTQNGYKTTILVVLENQNSNNGAIINAAYSEELEINDICWGSIENTPLINAFSKLYGIESTLSDTDEKPIENSTKNIKSGAVFEAFFDTDLIGLKFINLHTFHTNILSLSDNIFDYIGEIPASKRNCPCVVYARFGESWKYYAFRGKGKDSDVSDTYWEDSNYWTEIITEGTLENKFSEISRFKSYNYTNNDYVNSLIKEIHIEGEKDENLLYFVRSCQRNRTGISGYSGAYFAICSYNPDDGTISTVFEYGTAERPITKSGIYKRTHHGFTTSIYVTLENQNSNDGAVYRVNYSDDVKINDICWESIENAPLIALSSGISINRQHVDLIMFMGQSNMAGRGITNSEHPESAPAIIDGAGFEYKAISSPNTLSYIQEPFGINENVTGAIDDGNRKTGSMVTAFINAYYETTKKITVGVSASEGGTTISQWQPNTSRLNDAISRMSAAVTYLTNNGYTIDHQYMVWCQGESDGDNHISKEDYKSLFLLMLEEMVAAGIEDCFVVRIGKYNGSATTTDYSNVINAQTELCQEHSNIIMASTALASFKDKGLMKDSFHYYQDAYNLVGKYAGRNSGLFRLYGIEKPQYDVMSETLYVSEKCY